jgi:hypothetical protein
VDVLVSGQREGEVADRDAGASLALSPITVTQ